MTTSIIKAIKMLKNYLQKTIAIIVVAIMILGCATTNSAQALKNLKLTDGIKFLNNKEYMKANQVFEKYCKSDHARACAMLSHSYTDGLGVHSDEHKAVKFMAKSCKLGDNSACGEIRPIKEKFRFVELNKLLDENKIDKAVGLMIEACIKDTMLVMCKELSKHVD